MTTIQRVSLKPRFPSTIPQCLGARALDWGSSLHYTVEKRGERHDAVAFGLLRNLRNPELYKRP
jgi:hypothetical protein